MRTPINIIFYLGAFNLVDWVYSKKQQFLSKGMILGLSNVGFITHRKKKEFWFYFIMFAMIAFHTFGCH